MMVVYGWHEMNSVSWGIETIEIKPEDDILVSKDKVVMSDCPGIWYKSFDEAKKVALNLLRAEIKWLELAIQEVSSQKSAMKHECNS